MKKNILIIIGSVLILAIAVVFFIYSTQSTNVAQNVDKPEQNNDVAIENTDEEKLTLEDFEDENYVEEESNTEDIENVEYKDFVIYKEDKTEVKLSEYKNTPIMLLFFDPAVEDSMTVLKKVEDMYKDYENQIEFFMINTAEEVDEKLKDEYSLEIFYDFDGNAQKEYNIETMPSMIYIDKANEIMNAKSGVVSTDALEANLDILSNNF